MSGFHPAWLATKVVPSSVQNFLRPKTTCWLLAPHLKRGSQQITDEPERCIYTMIWVVDRLEWSQWLCEVNHVEVRSSPGHVYDLSCIYLFITDFRYRYIRSCPCEVVRYFVLKHIQQCDLLSLHFRPIWNQLIPICHEATFCDVSGDVAARHFANSRLLYSQSAKQAQYELTSDAIQCCIAPELYLHAHLCTIVMHFSCINCLIFTYYAISSQVMQTWICYDYIWHFCKCVILNFHCFHFAIYFVRGKFGEITFYFANRPPRVSLNRDESEIIADTCPRKSRATKNLCTRSCPCRSGQESSNIGEYDNRYGRPLRKAVYVTESPWFARRQSVRQLLH